MRGARRGGTEKDDYNRRVVQTGPISQARRTEAVLVLGGWGGGGRAARVGGCLAGAAAKGRAGDESYYTGRTAGAARSQTWRDGRL